MRLLGISVSYDKRHLLRMAHEDEHYAPGTTQLIVEVDGWKVRPLVCYDLRFPVWSRNRIGTDGGYDVLLYVANWPERRRFAWQTLLRARAIENLCYCVGEIGRASCRERVQTAVVDGRWSGHGSQRRGRRSRG